MEWSFFHIVIAVIIVAPAVAFVGAFIYGGILLAMGKEDWE